MSTFGLALGKLRVEGSTVQPNAVSMTNDHVTQKRHEQQLFQYLSNLDRPLLERIAFLALITIPIIYSRDTGNSAR